MPEKLLSICISTYNRRAECIKLIQSIFTLKDNRYNVVVCDDASTDGTVGNLRELGFPKLDIKVNKRNLGPCRNWYNTINSGTAKYILHVLDRDTLNIMQLQYLLELLEKYDISGGYIGMAAIESVPNRIIGKKTYMYNKGEEAFLYMGAIPVHPTGFIVRRQYWEQCQFKKYFYQIEKYGIYPHSYVMAHMALRGDMIYVRSDFCSYKYVGKNSRSRFYQFYKAGHEFWWTPESVLKVAVKLVIYLYPYAGTAYQDNFIVRRFGEGLYRATMSYRETLKNKEEMSHYGLTTKKISNMELFMIGIWYYFAFCSVLEKVYADDSKQIKIALRRNWKKIMTGIWKNL